MKNKKLFTFSSLIAVLAVLTSCNQTTTTSSSSSNTSSSLSNPPVSSSSSAAETSSSPISSESSQSSSSSSSSSSVADIPSEIKTKESILTWFNDVALTSTPSSFNRSSTTNGTTSLLQITYTGHEVKAIDTSNTANPTVNSTSYLAILDGYYYSIEENNNASVQIIADETDYVTKISLEDAEEEIERKLTKNYLSYYDFSFKNDVKIVEGTTSNPKSADITSYAVTTLDNGYFVQGEAYNETGYNMIKSSFEFTLNSDLLPTAVFYDYNSYTEANWDLTTHAPKADATVSASRSLNYTNIKYENLTTDEEHPLFDVTPYFVNEITDTTQITITSTSSTGEYKTNDVTVGDLDLSFNIPSSICLPTTALDTRNIKVTEYLTPDLFDEWGGVIKAGTAKVQLGTVLHPNLCEFEFEVKAGTSSTDINLPLCSGINADGTNVIFNDVTQSYTVKVKEYEPVSLTCWLNTFVNPGPYDFDLSAYKEQCKITTTDGVEVDENMSAKISWIETIDSESFLLEIQGTKVGTYILSIPAIDPNTYQKGTMDLNIIVE